MKMWDNIRLNNENEAKCDYCVDVYKLSNGKTNSKLSLLNIDKYGAII